MSTRLGSLSEIDRSLPMLVLIAASLLVPACSKSIRDTVDDATITAQVQTVLLNDPDIGASKIDVRTRGGVVAVAGTVANKTEEGRALALIHQVPGVKDVRSLLEVADKKSEVSQR
jgi:osmotically-inducible protein OsmY